MVYMIVALIVLPTLCVIATVYFVYNIVLQISRQRRLYNSIRLVEFQVNKLHYIIFAAITVLFSIYIVFQMFDSRSVDAGLFLKYFNLERMETNIALGAVLLASLSFLGLLITLIIGKSAIVDKGVYTGLTYIDWYYLHDYIIDMKNSAVILTTNRSAFLTLLGTTPPLKVDSHDIQKLIFILNKNKNKFNQAIS